MVVQPAGAVAECQAIAQRLLDEGWVRHADCIASPDGTPADQLRAIRLFPPDTKLYFIELLAFPAPSQRAAKEWIPCHLSDGVYGLPSLRYLGVTGIGRQMSNEGLAYADPAMMALANLLAHSRVSPDLIESGTLKGMRRSSKDLGRVMALARLAGRSETEGWVAMWKWALRETFTEGAPLLTATLGAGLRELLADPPFLMRRSKLSPSVCSAASTSPATTSRPLVTACWSMPWSLSKAPSGTGCLLDGARRHHRNVTSAERALSTTWPPALRS